MRIIALSSLFISLSGCLATNPTTTDSSEFSPSEKKSIQIASQRFRSQYCADMAKGIRRYPKSQTYASLFASGNDPTSLQIVENLKKLEKTEEALFIEIDKRDADNDNFKSNACQGVATIFEIIAVLETNYYRALDTDRLLQAVVEGIKLDIKSEKVNQTPMEAVKTQSNVAFSSEFITALHNRSLDSANINIENIIRNAVDYMMTKLDGNSSVLWPAQYSALFTRTTGKSGALGLELLVEGNQVKVFDVMNTTNEVKSSIFPGDEILSVNGESMQGKSLLHATNALRGDVGSKVKLVVARQGQVFQFDLRRQRLLDAEIIVKPLNTNVLYIHIFNFHGNTASNLKKAVSTLLKSLSFNSSTHFNGLVLDLRGNPGGLLSSAVEVADYFIDKGNIVSLVARTEKNRMNFVASSTIIPELANARIAILVDKFSGSAVSIIADALKQHKNAVIVGTPTHPKASIQTIYPLKSKNTALKFTSSLIKFSHAEATESFDLLPDYCSRLNKTTQKLDFIKTNKHEQKCERNRWIAVDLRQQEIEFARTIVGMMHKDL